MKVLVLGAGVVGVSSAWHLADHGHEVHVVERQPDVALETSFANGGQISVSHAEPWANPGTPLRVLKWLGREESPLLWRLRADLAQWRWGLDFLAECRPARTRHNIQAIIQLGLYSRSRLQTLRRKLGLEYDALERGILHFYTEDAEYRNALRQAAIMREFGCDRQATSVAQCLAIEPTLAQSSVPLVGGTFTASDESGDARRFTVALAEKCKARGISFHFDTPVAALQADAAGHYAVVLGDGRRLAADAVVVALGSYSTALLRPLGYRLPVYPAKGYSITIPLGESDVAPTVSLTDDGRKIVFSRLGGRLRVAGTAEFCGYDVEINEARCRAIVRRTEEIFPALRARAGVEFWAGLRPATPGNVPLIGRVGRGNLWLNTGHGTLGWTLACGSASLLADLLSGRQPDIDPRFYQGNCMRT